MLTLAQEAAKRAGEVLRAQFGRASLTVEHKGRADYVTEADRRAEDAVRELLAAEAPDHGILFEEGGLSQADAEYRWVVDALDGTTNYIHRYPFFAVSIALLHRGQPRVGVVYDPMRGEMFAAEDGEPTTVNGVAVSVSKAAALGDALLCTGFPFRCEEELPRYLNLLGGILTKSAGVRRDGSAALDLAYVAAGRFDGFFELGLMPWDVAAGALLVKQAGGEVTDFAGGNEALAGGDIVASNGLVHGSILAETSRVFASRPVRRGGDG